VAVTKRVSSPGSQRKRPLNCDATEETFGERVWGGTFF
jgi:hypothetical protein